MKAKVLRNYKQKSDTGLGESAQRAHDAFVDQNGFPVGSLTAVAFQDVINNFNTAVGVADGGSKADTANKKNLRVEIIGIMDLLADNVDQQCGGDPAYILNHGFDHTATSHSAVNLGVPIIKTVLNPASGKLKLIIQSVAGASGYEVEISIGTGPWVLQPAFTSTRNMVLENLVSGTLYSLRVRAMGGNQKHGDWSDVVQHVCT